MANSLQNTKCLDWTKFKAIADGKLKCDYIIMIFVYTGVERCVGSGESAGD